MKNTTIVFLVLFVFNIGVSSCSKDDNPTENNQSVGDAMTFISEVNDIIALTEDALNDFDPRMRISEIYDNDCKTIIHKPAQKQVLIDFGNSSCVLEDGRSRKGKIIITYSGRYRTEGSEIQINLDNYVSSNVQLYGGIQVINRGNNNYEIQLKNLRIPIDEEDSAKWEGTFSKSWTAGLNTTDLTDDQYEFAGSYTGTDKLKQAFTGSITSPLLINYDCLVDGNSFPTKGVTEMVTKDFASRKIDFGQGNCDKSVVLTVRGDAETIRFGD
jgi:hypothetical protein